MPVGNQQAVVGDTSCESKSCRPRPESPVLPPCSPTLCPSRVSRGEMGTRGKSGRWTNILPKAQVSAIQDPPKDSHSNGTERQFRVKGPALTGSEEKILEEKGAPQEAFW